MLPLFANLRLRRARAWAALLAALAVGLALTPLFNLLAYEFCLALALAASLAAAHLGSAYVAVARQRDEGMVLALRPPRQALLSLLGRATACNLALLALPLALISANALRVKNCDYLEGLAFFALLPVLSTILATATGVLTALLVPRAALASALALLAVLGSLAWGVYRFYDAPPVFGYDPFAGYFPGTLYDEDLAIRAPLLWYRLHNLLWLVGAVLLAARFFDAATLRLVSRPRGPESVRPGRAGAALFLGAAALLFHLRTTIGFAHDAGSIRAALGGVRHTTHFDIHYPAELDDAAVELLAQDHELRYAQLRALLGVAPPRVRSFIFRSAEEKRALMGAGQTFVAKPWRREVYLQQARFPHGVLRHELAHVFAGEFGDRLFGVSLAWRLAPLPHPRFNVGLIEGLAVAADNRAHGELSLHQSAAALVRLGLAPPLESLFGVGFLTHAAGRAYTLAGSFCRFLLDRHGAARLRAVYRSGGDFAAAYGQALATLAAEWSRFLAGVAVPEDQLQLARETFRRPSILRRVCSHEVANLLAAAAELRGRARDEEAAHVLERVVAHDPDEPRHLLELMAAHAAARRPDAALALEPRLLRHPALSAALRRQVLELGGDLRWRAGDVAGARAAYGAATTIGAFPADRRVLLLKRWAMGQDEAVLRAVRDYLVPPPGKKRDGALEVHLAYTLRELLPSSGLGLYLAGKQLAGRGECREAASVLRRALTFALPAPELVREGRLALAQCLYETRDLDGAAAELSTLAAGPDLPAGVQLNVADWQQRVSWRRGHPNFR